jgi:predicted TPR repeat methyltransferase
MRAATAARSLLICIALLKAVKAYGIVTSRRRWLQRGCAGLLILAPTPSDADDASDVDDSFVSAGFKRAEYTNSITASRDTNISPKEVYDTISRIKGREGTRALDLGCGAGVSTQTLYEMGYTTIDACDWSNDAWNINVIENGHCPDSVHFYQLDDERFVRWWKEMNGEKYNAIVFNFAINQNKAVQFATELLEKDGVLLAPVNTQQDYWLKQQYQLLDSSGKIIWTASDVGAWSVQFQPDTTQDTCQGIWCPPFNGFQKQR